MKISKNLLKLLAYSALWLTVCGFSLTDEADEKDTAILRIADILPQKAGMGETGNPVPPETLMTDLDRLGLVEKDLEDLLSFLGEAKEGITAFYTAMT